MPDGRILQECYDPVVHLPTPTRRRLLALAATAAIGTVLWMGMPYARLAWMRTRPRESAELTAVSSDGTRMVLVERPSSRVVERDEGGERPLRSGFAVGARLGPGVVYIADFDLLGRPKGTFVGIDTQCDPLPPADSPWSMPVWRSDGLAMLRLMSAGIVFDGLGPCNVLTGATSAAFVGDVPTWSDGDTVWVDGRAVWRGTRIRLMMAAGATWVLSDEGFGAVTTGGVTLRETFLALRTVWEMPHGVCLVDDADGLVQLAHPPNWGARCWHPGEALAVEHPRGTIPIDVDLRFEPETHSLRNVFAGDVRALPEEFPVFHSTRPLPDGRVRSFHESGYWQLGADGTVTEVRWSPDTPDRCGDCGEPTWRSPFEVR